jgi:predicted dehydrogenase
MTEWRPRVAIIGTGGIAHVHVRMIRDLGGELVAVCGRTLGAASAFGHADPYDDPARMLRERAPEIVHVCSPHHLHAEHSVAALAAGAHVLCEKPMATKLDDGLRMIDAAARAGRTGAIAYTYRGYPLIEVLRSKLAADHFGNLRRVGGCYLSQDVFAADKYVWMFSPGTTGDSYVLMDLGVHWLDLVEFVTRQRHHKRRFPRPPQHDRTVNRRIGTWCRLEPARPKRLDRTFRHRQHNHSALARGSPTAPRLDVEASLRTCGRLRRCVPQCRVPVVGGDAGRPFRLP